MWVFTRISPLAPLHSRQILGYQWQCNKLDGGRKTHCFPLNPYLLNPYLVSLLDSHLLVTFEKKYLRHFLNSEFVIFFLSCRLFSHHIFPSEKTPLLSRYICACRATVVWLTSWPPVIGMRPLQDLWALTSC